MEATNTSSMSGHVPKFVNTITDKRSLFSIKWKTLQIFTSTPMLGLVNPQPPRRNSEPEDGNPTSHTRLAVLLSVLLSILLTNLFNLFVSIWWQTFWSTITIMVWRELVVYYLCRNQEIFIRIFSIYLLYTQNFYLFYLIAIIPNMGHIMRALPILTFINYISCSIRAFTASIWKRKYEVE